MLRTSNRRIVRRTLLAIAGVVLLPLGYAGSVVTLIYLLNAGIVPLTAATKPPVEAYVTPLWWYMDSGWPGGRACDDMLRWSKTAGQRMAGKQL